jgi:seryl-tRNA synthetase
LQANKNHVQDLQTAHNEYTADRTEQAARLQRAEEKAKEAEARSNAAIERAVKAENSLAEKEKEKKAVQSELDDLLMVFGDLEETSEKYKERLKELGENVSDGEGVDEDEAEEEDDVD